MRRPTELEPRGLFMASNGAQCPCMCSNLMLTFPIRWDEWCILFTYVSICGLCLRGARFREDFSDDSNW